MLPVISWKHFDFWLLGGLCLLLLFGVWMMSSVSVFNSYAKEVSRISQDFCKKSDTNTPDCRAKEGRAYAEFWCEQNNCNARYLTSQIRNIFAGFGGLFIAFFIPILWWRFFSVFLYAIGMFLLIYTLIKPLQGEGFSANNWISIFGVSFQGVEFMKFALIFYFSLWMEKKEQEVQTLESGFFPFTILIALTALPVMAQPDFGGSIILISIAVAIFFVAGGRILHLMYSGGLGIISLVLAGIFSGHVRDRLATFIDLSKASEAARHQIEQSFLSIGNGGLFGAGNSTQSFGFLPEIQGDMIFAAVSEQMGFIGMIVVIALYFFIAYRGIRIASNAPDRFSALVATGITAWFISQSVVNMFVVTGLFPVTGITLPFVSYGGSSMLMSLTSMGVLLHISSLSHESPSRRGGNWWASFSRHSRRS
ncbi:MAG: putative peptidoglycan glycosyltransferase FtsW [Candidatus Peregrinibacteria bacterium]